MVSKPTCGCRAAAEAWEAAFVELARTQLTGMAANAGLRLSFSSERSVADELARESYADVSTVRACSEPALVSNLRSDITPAQKVVLKSRDERTDMQNVLFCLSPCNRSGNFVSYSEYEQPSLHPHLTPWDCFSMGSVPGSVLTPLHLCRWPSPTLSCWCT